MKSENKCKGNNKYIKLWKVLKIRGEDNKKNLNVLLTNILKKFRIF